MKNGATKSNAIRGRGWSAGAPRRASARKSASFAIAPATGDDMRAIAALLRAAELPHDDIGPHVANFFVARAGDGAIAGAAGAEVCGADALLRSLVVAAEWRGAGLGSRLVATLDDTAARWGVRRWWLLTTTAEAFFTARGFRVADRDEAPEAIRRTKQFDGGCCCSAICMTRERKGEKR